MIPGGWRSGSSEVAVIGLARSGAAVTRWLRTRGLPVYASDIGDSEPLRQTAAELRRQGAVVDLGKHDLDRIRRAIAVIVSPGVDPAAEPLAAARSAQREVLAEIDVAARALQDTELVAITGTNGKTTTTALTAHLLRTGGLAAEAGGNIGRPLIELASLDPRPDWVVAEVSSFQLHDSPHLTPAVGVITNLAPNHLDRYATVEEYYADKQLLFRNASDRSVWILNGDDQPLLDLARGVKGRLLRFSTRDKADAWYDRAKDMLMLRDTALMKRVGLPLLGDHNVENALAAALVAQIAGLTPRAIVGGLQSFRALEHRLEPVREVNGVLWINDSKATNVTAAGVAIRAMRRPFVWLAGGKHKGEPYTPLIPLLRTNARGAVVFGEAAPLIVRDLSAAIPVNHVPDLAAAVRRAGELAQPGDAVLLSPACSSFDQFTNYEERGAAFRSAVLALP